MLLNERWLQLAPAEAPSLAPAAAVALPPQVTPLANRQRLNCHICKPPQCPTVPERGVTAFSDSAALANGLLKVQRHTQAASLTPLPDSEDPLF
ncbi:hypothetical protein F2P81_007934 [Scophthalmus maximus]|uniref:Uncharacterized protein n=1 Tax=Scophthalmus maximus TaxID=52904 RepID=A0A6A4T474_SCOMX|nr:hypothetical protein F2P81_007934 [Scophthalmus maximus]